ncbi:MAG: PTS sugar transporter subunit IIC [Clostridia bacterium]|nr:PTS sugar transporter subunit IIC [Clostridia bacterium]
MTRIKSAGSKLMKRWFIDALSGMALGLFATLIIGTIFEQLGKLIGVNNVVGYMIVKIAAIAKLATGAGIGAGIAYALKADKLTIFSCIAAGLIGANATGYITNFAIAPGIGNPVGAYVTSIFAAEICRFVSGKTKIDIVLVPLTALVVSSIIAVTLCPPVALLIKAIAAGIEVSMRWSPFVMGVVIAVVMGILLTLPTSSAAIWVSIVPLINPSPEMLLAGGAAVVGCAAHMVGFAVMSLKENGLGGLIAQGLGTSMLQIPNLMKNPIILIPPVIASAIVGPLATTVFKLKTGATGGGMGTSGLVGVFSTIENSTDISTGMLVFGIILLMFVIPAVVSWSVCLLLRKLNWIKENDLKLNL